MPKYTDMTPDTAYKSFRAYESLLDKQVKAGLIDQGQARSFLEASRKNYKNQNYNRQLERINAN